MPDSDHLRSPSLFSALAALTVLTLSTCQSPQPAAIELTKSDIESTYRDIVVKLGEQSSLRETYRLASAALEKGDDSPPLMTPAQLELVARNERVRLWLQERFEPTHRPEDIPKSTLERFLADASVRRSAFHPRLHSVCQVIIKPGPATRNTGFEIDPLTNKEWQAEALAQTRSWWLWVNQHLDALKKEKTCRVYFRTAVFEERPAGQLSTETLKELGVFDVSNKDQLVGEFVDAVFPINEPGFVPPFFTKFGLHLVYVLEVLPSNLPDGTMEDGALAAARTEALRELMHPKWQAQQFTALVAHLREETPVRLRIPGQNGDAVDP